MMHNISELEKKWKNYRWKRIKKPLIVTSILALFGASGFIWFSYFKETNNDKYLINGNLDAQSKDISIGDSDSSGDAMVIQRGDSKRGSSDIDYGATKIVKTNVPDEEVRLLNFDNQKEKEEMKNKYSGILIPEKRREHIREREIERELLDKFESDKTAQNALELAKYYYKKGNYAKAEVWAINANNIDGDIEDSWILFSKARAKQNYRVDAIKIMQSYYEETGSKRAKELLDKLRNGKPFD